MDFAFTDQQLALRDHVRAFTRTEIAPHAAEYDRNPVFPHAIFRRMAEEQLLGLTAPPEYGGRGLDTMSLVLAVEEIAKGDG